MKVNLNPRRVESVLVSSSGSEVTVDEGAIHVHIPSEVDEGNSSNVALGAGATFEGVGKNVLEFAMINVTVHSNVDSADNGLVIQISSDGVTGWREADAYSITGDKEKTFAFQANKKFFRVQYTNGAVAQTTFDLQAVLKRMMSLSTSHRNEDFISGQDDLSLVKAVIAAKRPDGVYSNINATRNDNLRVSISEYGDTPAIDAFARLRVSDPYTLFDSKQLHDKQPLFWDEVIAGSATSTHVPVDAATQMRVTANAADYVIRQTKQRFNYQPGKSQLVFMTYMATSQPGSVARVGYFDGTGANNLTPFNGIFFETNNELSWNICKNGVITERVVQADWNVDKLDGTGASGITYYPDGAQILILDFEWLGVGRARCGFVISGVPFYSHTFEHSNDPAFPSVYMSSPNLPLRYTLETDGTTVGSLDHICSTVISEGGIQKTGILRTATTTSPLIGLSTGVTYAMTGIRLKTAYLDVTIIPESISVLATTNDNFIWRVTINPTIAGTFTYTDKTNSAVQEAFGTLANTVSDDGLVIASGFASSSSRTAEADLQTALRIGSTIAGVRDTLVLMITPITNNITAYGALNFRELL